MTEKNCSVKDFYKIDQSPFYKLGSKSSLSKILGIDKKSLLKISYRTSYEYRTWGLKEKPRDRIAGILSNKKREIQEPKPDLRRLHKRISLLLSRICKPDFMNSATKGRAYDLNARAHSHRTSEKSLKIDIKKFYPSVRQSLVERFFLEDMKCAPDIARLIARLCCVNGKLPTGSPVSPVLSYFACRPMFDEISNLALKNELTFTLYVDDMFFSGNKLSGDLRFSIIKILSRYGFKGHKICQFRPGQPRVITGVALTAEGLKIPFSRIKRMRVYREKFDQLDDKVGVDILGKTLLGQYREAARIDRRFLSYVPGVERKMNKYRS